MSNYYNLDGIKTELIKKINLKKGELELWEKVKFVTKKDGTPFKILSKNINNARIIKPSYNLQDGENELAVGGWVDGHGYINDYINIHCLVKYLKGDKKEKTFNYLPKQPYLEQVYVFDIEDIKEAVILKIEEKKEVIARLERDLTLIDNAYNNFKEAFGKAIEQLNIDIEKSDNSNSYYMILDTIVKSYPYC